MTLSAIQRKRLWYVYTALFIVVLVLVLLNAYFARLSPKELEWVQKHQKIWRTEHLKQLKIDRDRDSDGYVPPPKILWTHWHSDEKDLPELQRRCLDRARRVLAPPEGGAWDVRFISTATFFKMFADADVSESPLMPLLRTLDSTQLSDFVRLWLLETYGGLYSDIGIVYNDASYVNGIYDRCVERRAELSAFQNNFLWGIMNNLTNPCIENFFLLASKGSPLIRAWKTQYLEALDLGPKTYKRCIKAAGVEIHAMHRSPYFSSYHALQTVIQKIMPRAVLSLERVEQSGYKVDNACLYVYMSCVKAKLTAKAAHAIPLIKLTKATRPLFPMSYFSHPISSPRGK